MTEQRKDEAQPPAPSDEPKRPRQVLWQAIAGMALAIAIWAGLIAVEFSGEITHVSTVYRHHIQHLEQDIRRLHHDVAMAHHELDLERGRTASRDDLTRVLNAPDAQLIKLAAPRDGAARGLATISRSLDSAILEVDGLPASPPGKVYTLWWVTRDGRRAKGAEFALRSGGAVTIIALTMPPRARRLTSCEITLEPAAGARRPTGVVALSGTLHG